MTYLSSRSIPGYRRPHPFAARSVCPDPQKLSKTRSPASLNVLISCSASPSGKTAGGSRPGYWVPGTNEAIVDYGKERGWEFLQLLGVTRRRGLCKATYSRIFRRIDVAAFEAAISRWICGRLEPGDTPHLAIDGKPLRGSRDGETPAIPSCPLTPRMSKPSWPRCGSMPRPTN